MNKGITCIVCPLGCALNLSTDKDGKLIVQGNKCPKGKAFGETEVLSPTRTLTTTVKTVFPFLPLMPVRTAEEIPKEDVGKVLETLGEFVLEKPVRCGDVIMKNAAGLGCDIIATRTVD